MRVDDVMTRTVITVGPTATIEQAAKAFGIDPSASLFIDDSQKNVDGARAAGWQAVLFTDVPTLERDLRQLGVKW